MNEYITCFISSPFTFFLLLLNFQLIQIEGKEKFLALYLLYPGHPFSWINIGTGHGPAAPRRQSIAVCVLFLLLRESGWRMSWNFMHYSSHVFEKILRCLSLSWMLRFLHHHHHCQQQQQQTSRKTSCGRALRVGST